MNRIKRDLKQIISDHHGSLSKAKITYFKRSFQLHPRLLIFYCIPKVHKNPIALHPVVSTTNSFSAVFSVWLDYKIKELLPHVKSYVKNSTSIINELKHMVIPENAQVFTAGAKSMYTNIDTTTGIQSIREFLDTNKEIISPDFPSYLFLEVLEAVMQNNIFSFGNTFWLQLTGTAMGTPVACAYATVTYRNYENNLLLPKFQENLLYYCRYIDDVLGIWLPPPNNTHTIWEDFKVQLNNWGLLEWQIEEPSNKTTFLDLNIALQNSSITFSTCQKPLNLYLYLPPLSAHPRSCLKRLIQGELNRYLIQNNPTNFQTLVSEFIERLTARGHSIDALIPLLLQAANSLD